VKINAETYRKKYAGNLVQYDQNLNVLTNAPNVQDQR
jgi:small nuclear ribonucleoprotein (snRNP)-like protein